MNPKKLTAYRRNHLGYVFQMYKSISILTVPENIRGGATEQKAATVDELLHTLGLWDHRNKLPNQQPSGGQQQRTAIGRAIVSCRFSS